MKPYYALALSILLILQAGCAKKDYKVRLIVISSSSCEACAKLAPSIESLKKRHSKEVGFTVLDVNKEGDGKKASMYGYTKVPTVIFLDGGLEYFRLENTVQEDVIEALIISKLSPLPPVEYEP
jgi:thiol-disulfide isomerase/thioredoxin